jgi:hypothetical protein
LIPHTLRTSFKCACRRSGRPGGSEGGSPRRGGAAPFTGGEACWPGGAGWSVAESRAEEGSHAPLLGKPAGEVSESQRGGALGTRAGQERARAGSRGAGAATRSPSDHRAPGVGNARRAGARGAPRSRAEHHPGERRWQRHPRSAAVGGSAGFLPARPAPAGAADPGAEVPRGSRDHQGRTGEDKANEPERRTAGARESRPRRHGPWPVIVRIPKLAWKLGVLFGNGLLRPPEELSGESIS